MRHFTVALLCLAAPSLAAARAVAREGASVGLIEPTRWIGGGMVTGGIAGTDSLVSPCSSSMWKCWARG